MKRKNRDYPFYDHTYINNLKELLDLRYNETPNDIASSKKILDEYISKFNLSLYQQKYIGKVHRALDTLKEKS